MVYFLLERFGMYLKMQKNRSVSIRRKNVDCITGYFDGKIDVYMVACEGSETLE